MPKIKEECLIMVKYWEQLFFIIFIVFCLIFTLRPIPQPLLILCPILPAQASNRLRFLLSACRPLCLVSTPQLTTKTKLPCPMLSIHIPQHLIQSSFDLSSLPQNLFRVAWVFISQFLSFDTPDIRPFDLKKYHTLHPFAFFLSCL